MTAKWNQKGPLKEVKSPHYRRLTKAKNKKEDNADPGTSDITSQKQKNILKNNIYLIKKNYQHHERLVDAIIGHYDTLRIISAENKKTLLHQ